MKLDVVGFGALNVDQLYRVDQIAGKGEERIITGFTRAAGGSAANSIVGLARLGHQTGYIGKVGNDDEGKFLLKSFIDEKVDTSGIIISEAGRSGVILGFVDNRGERALYVNPGVNDTLGVEDVDMGYARSAQFLHLTSFVGLKPFHAQKTLLKTLSDVRVSLDPGELYAQKGLDVLKPLLNRSFVVFPNERELKLMTGKGYEAGARVLIKERVNIVAVKLGEKGCYVTDGEEEFLVEAFQVKVIDTTGAGDAFCAGFLHGLLSGKDLYTCGKLGNCVAGHKIQKNGARMGLPKLFNLSKI